MGASQPNPLHVLLVCPGCRARLHPSSSQSGKQIFCPKCGLPLTVPQAHAAATVAGAVAPPNHQTAPAAAGDPAPQGNAAPGENAAPQGDPAPRGSSESLIPVVCFTCGTRMYARFDQLGQKIKCPDCFVETLVEAPREKPKPRPRVEPGEYTFREEVPLEPQPEPFPVLCPLCNTRLHFTDADVDTSVHCPDCNTQFTVPKRPHAQGGQTVAVVGMYDMSPAQEISPPKPLSTLPESVRRPEPPPEPPGWTFFSGVLLFPWRRRDALQHWVYLSGGLTINGLLFALVLSSFVYNGLMGALVAAFPSLGVVWTFLWSYGYGASCLFAIVNETAEGNDEIYDWPSPDWRDWILPLVHVLYHVALSGAVGYGVVRATNAPPEIAIPTAIFLLWPVFYVSSLECGATWMPYSLIILGSMFRSMGAWITYYLLAAIVVALAFGGLLLGLQGGFYVAALVGGPCLAAGWLIVARLLGRLVWRISHVQEVTGESASRRSRSTEAQRAKSA